MTLNLKLKKPKQLQEQLEDLASIEFQINEVQNVLEILNDVRYE